MPFDFEEHNGGGGGDDGHKGMREFCHRISAHIEQEIERNNMCSSCARMAIGQYCVVTTIASIALSMSSKAEFLAERVGVDFEKEEAVDLASHIAKELLSKAEEEIASVLEASIKQVIEEGR